MKKKGRTIRYLMGGCVNPKKNIEQALIVTKKYRAGQMRTKKDRAHHPSFHPRDCQKSLLRRCF